MLTLVVPIQMIMALAFGVNKMRPMDISCEMSTHLSSHLMIIDRDRFPQAGRLDRHPLSDPTSPPLSLTRNMLMPKIWALRTVVHLQEIMTRRASGTEYSKRSRAVGMPLILKQATIPRWWMMKHLCPGIPKGGPDHHSNSLSLAIEALKVKGCKSARLWKLKERKRDSCNRSACLETSSLRNNSNFNGCCLTTQAWLSRSTRLKHLGLRTERRVRRGAVNKLRLYRELSKLMQISRRPALMPNHCILIKATNTMQL